MNSYTDELKNVYYINCMRPDRSPASLLEIWSGFVIECQNCYQFDLSEFDNDLEVRRDIQIILSASDLQIYPDLKVFAGLVEQIDNEFRDLICTHSFRPYNSSHWWDHGILSRAGKEYVNDIRELYNIVITECHG